MVITESNINDMKYEVEQSIEKFGLIKTLKRYKFPFKLANIMFQLTRPFNNEECNEILEYYLFQNKVLSLPMFPELTISQVENISFIIKEFSLDQVRKLKQNESL